MIPKKGYTVRLAASVTLAEFGLALCDDDGVGLEIDRLVTGGKQQGVIGMPTSTLKPKL